MFLSHNARTLLNRTKVPPTYFSCRFSEEHCFSSWREHSAILSSSHWQICPSWRSANPLLKSFWQEARTRLVICCVKNCLPFVDQYRIGFQDYNPIEVNGSNGLCINTIIVYIFFAQIKKTYNCFEVTLILMGFEYATVSHAT